MSLVVAPLDQLYVKGGVLQVIVKTIEPSFTPMQLVGVTVPATQGGKATKFTIAVSLSVTVCALPVPVAVTIFTTEPLLTSVAVVE